MKHIAVVGTGIGGLAAAWWLSRYHRVTVFEANNYAGGHTHTVPVTREHGRYEVDTGFIVFNDRTYPLFRQLLAELGMTAQPTTMGFSVHGGDTALEYCGDGLGGFFAQRRNLLSPGHWRLLRDILRFNRQAPRWVSRQTGEPSLGELLDEGDYGEAFRRHYLRPMGAAIWSCGEGDIEDFPARFFVDFFHNHGLLSLRNRPQWYVVPGGSARYVEALLARLDAELRLGCPVQGVRRLGDEVRLDSARGSEVFDEVVLACHSDQALHLLSDADPDETTRLSGITWRENEVVLHTDTRLLPSHRRAWSSWNARLARGDARHVQVTYNMNILQGLDSPETFCVSLNSSDHIDPDRILGRYRFFHPLFTRGAVRSRAKILESNGRRHTWFCGAWCGNGFHEDGVASAAAVARALGVSL